MTKLASIAPSRLPLKIDTHIKSHATVAPTNIHFSARLVARQMSRNLGTMLLSGAWLIRSVNMKRSFVIGIASTLSVFRHDHTEWMQAMQNLNGALMVRQHIIQSPIGHRTLVHAAADKGDAPFP